MTLLLREFT